MGSRSDMLRASDWVDWNKKVRSEKLKVKRNWK